MNRKKVTILDIQAKKEKGEPITLLTAYDYPTALLVERSGIDILVTGDSIAMVALGLENTLPITMDELIYHCKAVARAAKHPLLIGDLPFMSYQVDNLEAIRNAGRFLKEGGFDAVKIEGGKERIDTIKAILKAGIPVMGHIGLTPQTISKLGGFRVQGKTVEAGRKLLEDAAALEEAGAFAIVIEAVPARMAGLITERVSVPTIGAGAGPHCDGQGLILNDVIGLCDRHIPKFAKCYVSGNEIFGEALTRFKQEVEDHSFPQKDNYYTMKDDVYEAILSEIE
jgi:3-methyl-2-oxobutanoate hydroxymethyltransferase